MLLRDNVDMAVALEAVERFDDRFPAHSRKPVGERCSVVPWPNGHRARGDDRAGVEPGIHLHDADSRLRIALEQGTLDRGRASPAGQE